MRKPTAKQFFCVEVAIWGAAVAWVIATNAGAPHVFLKVSVVNIGVAGFNMIVMIISSTIGWWPWRDEKD